jgi:hypothetical protein
MIHRELNRKIQIEHHEPHNVFYTLDSKQVDTPNTQILDRSLPWLGTDTSIKSGGLN